MRIMFLKKDWKNIKDVFLDNNIVLLNDDFKGFKIELDYSPAVVDVPFRFGDEVLLRITDSLKNVYEYDISLTSDYEYMYNLITRKFVEFETDYIENKAKTVIQIKEEQQNEELEKQQNEEEKHLDEFNNYIATGDINFLADCKEYWQEKKNLANTLKNYLINEVNACATSQLKIAFVLKVVYDKELYRVDDYKNIYDYAYDNFNIARGTVSNWLKVVDNFGVLNNETGFYSLDDRLKNFSITQLILVRGLTIEQIEQNNITSDMTTRDIKKIVADELKLKKIASTVTTDTVSDIPENPEDIEELYADCDKADVITDSNNQSINYDVHTFINPPVNNDSDNNVSDDNIDKPKAIIDIQGGLSLSDEQVNYLNDLFKSYKDKDIKLMIYVD